MVSKQVIQIIIEAEDKLSNVAKKAEESLEKLGDSGKKGLNGVNTASSKVQNTISKLRDFVDRARAKFNELRNSGQGMGATIKQSISNAATSFGQLITSSNTAKLAMEKIKSVSDGIKSKFDTLKSKIISFGSSAKSTLSSAFNISNIKAKLTNLGGSIDKLKGKLRSLAAEAKTTGSSGFGFLRQAASMTAGMLGYDLVNSMVENTRASLNARSSVQAFASRLNMSASEVNKFQTSLDGLQSTYKKIDMDVVGQQATDMAYRLGLPKTALTELTETTAIFSDAMQRNGRSAEDSMLAMSDAMDGQFVRLKEIGIGQEDLMRNGWDGDINNKTGLLKAMNKALKEQHYDELAKSVDTLDDAWQVLSITGGNLLETILLPLTPVIVQVVDALTNAVSWIQNFVGQLQDAWNGLPEWVQTAIEIAGVAIAIGVVVSAFGGFEAILIRVGMAIAPFISAIMGISWPLVAVVAAIGLVVAAIYEVGKAFGWWKDATTMLQAIGAGLQRMWDAFINHPDVQAVFKGIQDAIAWLGPVIGDVVKKVFEFFGVSTGNKWDAVRSIIDGIGIAWKVMSTPIRTVITILQILYPYMVEFFDNCLVPLGEFLVSVLTPVWEALVTIWSTVSDQVMILIDAFSQFQNGQMSLVDLIKTVASAIFTIWTTIAQQIISILLQLASRILNYAIKCGQNLLKGMITYIRQLPGRIYAFLLQVYQNLVRAGTQWVNTARNKAQSLVNNVINWLKTLPGRAYSALIAVVAKIISAGTQWVTNAKNKAKAVVDGVYTKLSSLPGKIASALGGVKDAIVKPFQDAYNTAKGWWDKIVNMASNTPKVNSTAGYDYLEGQNQDGSWSNTPKVYAGSDTSNVIVEQVDGELTFIHDLRNMPPGVDENLVAKLLLSSMSDEQVGKTLAENMGFQNNDLKIKNIIQGKNNRARGV